jgi:hypothetical protein
MPLLLRPINLHSHWLRWHDREILGRGEMRQSKSVPQHDVFVVEIRGRVGGYPGWEALRGFAGGLRDMAAGGVELGVVVWNVSISGVLVRIVIRESYTS